MKVLLTSTSFQDTPGEHHDLLNAQNWEVDRLRGPITEQDLMPIIANYDAVICGDDEYSDSVLRTGYAGRLRYLSKYGVGLDRINLATAKELGIPVMNCPGVNQKSVAEHVFGLIFCFSRQIHIQNELTHKGLWKRLIGNEIFGKNLGVFGLGAVGKEVALKGKALGLNILVCDKYLDESFARENNFEICLDISEMLEKVDFISLHCPHTPETHEVLNERTISIAKKGIVIVNTARGKLVNNEAILEGIKSGKIKGYLADVVDIEPIPNNHPFLGIPQIILTPHVGSRTYESVQRQGKMAIENLLRLIYLV